MAKITLVDDDENIVEALTAFFEAEGYQVRAYHDGASALVGLSETPPDIAILDVKMPKMDGMELLRKLRQTSNLPAIFLTSKDDEIDEVVGFNIGADDFIRKPCSTRLLADVIPTPMNESPADMHGLFAPFGSAAAPRINYREMIDTVRFDRKRAGLPVQRWHVVMNRVSSLPSRVGTIVNDRVAELAKEAGFEAIWRLRDRVVHRALALEGRTVFDTPADGKLTMSELSGRSEVRALLALIDRAPPQQFAKAA